MINKDIIRDRKKLSSDIWMYSIQRMDLLIIAISGSGLYVILEALKKSLEKPLPNMIYPKVAGVLFVLSIVVNFISQQLGKQSTHYDILMCEEKLCASEPATEEQEAEINRLDENSDYYDKWTTRCNRSSMCLMLIGVIILVGYFILTF